MLSNEAFLKDSKVVDLLKLRLSYGRSGFADSGATGVLSNYSSNGRYLFKDYYTNSYVGSFYMGSGEGVWQSSLVHMFLANAGVHAEKAASTTSVSTPNFSGNCICRPMPSSINALTSLPSIIR